MGHHCRFVGCWLLTFSTLHLFASSPPELITGVQEPRSATASGDSLSPNLSDDGRFVLFLSTASDLVAKHVGPGTLQVFVRDRQTGTTELISATPEGAPANGPCPQALMSGDGQSVVYTSRASNLVVNDSNHATDIFFHNRLDGITRLVSVATSAGSANGESRNPSLSADGRRIVFESDASDLIDNDTNGIADVFLFERDTGTLSRISNPSTDPTLGRQPSGASTRPLLSSDGSTVLFTSTARNLAPAIDVDGVVRSSRLFVARPIGSPLRMVNTFNSPSGSTVVTPVGGSLSADGQFAAMQVLSVTPSGRTLDAPCWLDLDDGTLKHLAPQLPRGYVHPSGDYPGPILSGDGSIVFIEAVGTLAGGATRSIVYAWHAASEQITRISTGGYTNAPTSDPPEFAESPFGELLGASPNADYVAYLGGTLDDAPTDRPARQLVLHRRSTGESRRVSRLQTREPVGDLDIPAASFSQDGHLMAFQCRSPLLVPDDLNNAYDIFIYDWETDSIELISAAHQENPSATDRRMPVVLPQALSHDGRNLLVLAVEEPFGEPSAGLQVYLVNVETGHRTLVSANAADTDPANRACTAAVMSSDARFVAFSSEASDLVDDDPNEAADVFLRDLLSDTTVMASRGAYDLDPASLSSSGPLVSADGAWTAFARESSSRSVDLWLYDVVAQSVSLISTNTAGSTPQRRFGCIPLSFTPDSAWIVFLADAVDLVDPPVPAVSGGLYAFAHHLITGETRALSSQNPIRGSDVSPPEALSRGTGIATDAAGRYVAFLRQSDLAVHDLATGELAVIANNGLAPSMSADGRLVAYKSRTPLSPATQILVADRQTGQAVTASVRTGTSEPGNGPSWAPLLTPNGRFLIFISAANDLTPNDANPLSDLFLRDLLTGTTTLVSRGVDGQSRHGVSGSPLLSGDGRILVFLSHADALIAGDYNQRMDLFSVRLPGPESDFRISTVKQLGSPSASLTWIAEEGVSYALEFASNLEEPDWQPLDIPFNVQGDQAIAEDTTGSGATRRYYRLVER